MDQPANLRCLFWKLGRGAAVYCDRRAAEQPVVPGGFPVNSGSRVQALTSGAEALWRLPLHLLVWQPLCALERPFPLGSVLGRLPSWTADPLQVSSLFQQNLTVLAAVPSASVLPIRPSGCAVSLCLPRTWQKKFCDRGDPLPAVSIGQGVPALLSEEPVQFFVRHSRPSSLNWSKRVRSAALVRSDRGQER